MLLVTLVEPVLIVRNLVLSFGITHTQSKEAELAVNSSTLLFFVFIKT